MNESTTQPICQSVFRDGTNRTSISIFTQKWAELISRLERSKDADEDLTQ